jgi:hypothetical protein
LAASLASSLADGNVYSLNVVGYVNVTLPTHKFTAVANPLDASMGGTISYGNNMTNLFSIATGNLFGGSSIAQFVSAANDYGTTITYNSATKKWASNFSMPPGKSALFFNAGASDTVITFTGQVEQGSYPVATLGSHQFSLIGSPVPIGGQVTNSTTVLNLAPSGGDTIATFNGAANDWNPVTQWNSATKKWSNTASATIGVAQGFLYFNASGTPNNWVSNFTVN